MSAFIAGSSVGDLQTIFYLALVGGILLGLVLFLLGVGFATLPGFYRQPDHRLLANLVTAAFSLALVFILATGAALLYAVTRRG